MPPGKARPDFVAENPLVPERAQRIFSETVDERFQVAASTNRCGVSIMWRRSTTLPAWRTSFPTAHEKRWNIVLDIPATKHKPAIGGLMFDATASDFFECQPLGAIAVDDHAALRKSHGEEPW